MERASALPSRPFGGLIEAETSYIWPLPTELVIMILSYLGECSLAAISLVNHSFLQLCLEDKGLNRALRSPESPRLCATEDLPFFCNRRPEFSTFLEQSKEPSFSQTSYSELKPHVKAALQLSLSEGNWCYNGRDIWFWKDAWCGSEFEPFSLWRCDQKTGHVVKELGSNPLKKRETWPHNIHQIIPLTAPYGQKEGLVAFSLFTDEVRIVSFEQDLSCPLAPRFAVNQIEPPPAGAVHSVHTPLFLRSGDKLIYFYIGDDCRPSAHVIGPEGVALHKGETLSKEELESGVLRAIYRGDLAWIYLSFPAVKQKALIFNLEEKGISVLRCGVPLRKASAFFGGREGTEWLACATQDSIKIYQTDSIVAGCEVASIPWPKERRNLDSQQLVGAQINGRDFLLFADKNSLCIFSKDSGKKITEWDLEYNTSCNLDIRARIGWFGPFTNRSPAVFFGCSPPNFQVWVPHRPKQSYPLPTLVESDNWHMLSGTYYPKLLLLTEQNAIIYSPFFKDEKEKTPLQPEAKELLPPHRGPLPERLPANLHPLATQGEATPTWVKLALATSLIFLLLATPSVWKRIRARPLSPYKP